jgi:hypothetical protein
MIVFANSDGLVLNLNARHRLNRRRHRACLVPGSSSLPVLLKSLDCRHLYLLRGHVAQE